MTTNEEYQRTIGTQHYETRKMRAVNVPVSQTEKVIYTAMALFLIVLIAGFIAVQNGWIG